MIPFASESVRWLRRNRAMLFGALAPLVAAPVLIAFALASDTESTAAITTLFGMVGLLAGIVATGYAIRANPRPVPEAGRIVADERGVLWNGALVAPRASLRAGFFVPTWGRPPRVLLERRLRRTMLFEVPDEETGRALLQALGLDTTQAAASLTFVSMARAEPRSTAIGLMLFLGALIGLPVLAGIFVGTSSLWPVAIGAIAVLGMIAWILALAMPTRAIVGSDGVLISWFWRKRFIRYADVKSVRPFAQGNVIGAAIYRTEGPPVKLPLPMSLTAELNQQSVALVVRRLQQALAGYRATREERSTALPARGDRPIGEWIRALRATGSGANADHRTAPVETDRLWRFVEDPGTDPITRASAAVALGGALDESGRARLRVSADATASPEVKGLLALAAEEASEGEIGVALERVARRG